jgi:hypothetical protein
MKKETYHRFKGFPVIGNGVKVAYIGGLVNNLVKGNEKKESKMELTQLTGNELEKAINREANDMFDEFIMPEITKEGIPEFLVSRAKTKGIKEITISLKKKMVEKAQDKIDKPVE